MGVFILVGLSVLFTLCLGSHNLLLLNPLSKINVPHVKIDVQDNIKLTVDPSVMYESGQWVLVQFSGVTNPAPDSDYVSLYDAKANFNESAPIKYQMAWRTGFGSPLGSGTLRFRLLNYRTDLVFVFVRNGFSNPVIHAISNEIKVMNPNEPLQPHLAFTDEPNALSLVWITKESDTPVVLYGLTPGTYDWMSYANDSYYTRDMMCGPPANTSGWMDPGIIHYAVLDHLLPNTRYYYTFGDVFGFGKEYSFMSPPVISPSVNVNFFAFGDMGQSEIDGSMETGTAMPASINTTNGMLGLLADYQLVLHIGDISYARGYQSQWENFFDQIGPIASQLPYLTCIGNHERDYPNSGGLFNGFDSGGECGIAYEMRLRMPRPSLDQPWYSFNYGSVHFIFMSTEHDFSINSLQYQFILQDLSSVKRTETPWVIFSGHRPMYVDSTNDTPDGGDQPVAQALRANLENLLLKYEVDLALWGHHHSYQRTCPVFGEKCVEIKKVGQYVAPIHVVIGAAGADFSQNLKPELPEYTLFVSDSIHGFLRVNATQSLLRWEFVNSADGSVVDEYEINLPYKRR